VSARLQFGEVKNTSSSVHYEQVALS